MGAVCFVYKKLENKCFRLQRQKKVLDSKKEEFAPFWLMKFKI